MVPVLVVSVSFHSARLGSETTMTGSNHNVHPNPECPSGPCSEEFQAVSFLCIEKLSHSVFKRKGQMHFFKPILPIHRGFVNLMDGKIM